MTIDWKRLKHSSIAPFVAIVADILIVYVVFLIARVEFLMLNWSIFAPNLTWTYASELFRGSLVFDTSAIIYTNALWLLLVLLPIPCKENEAYRKVCQWLFVITNSLSLLVNFADSVYFPYTLRRTTWTVFHEFGNENNIMGIMFHELWTHWYLVLLFALLVWLIWKSYRTPRMDSLCSPWWKYVAANLSGLLLAIILCIGGVRGGFATAIRPITVSNANQYADRPTDAALVLNTPFSLLRTIGVEPFVVPDYFSSTDQAAQIFTPEHQPSVDAPAMERRNVCIFIIESFGREYIGALNKDLENGTYQGYTPFVDSLIDHSVTWQWSFCNGRKSIDGMPSILSSIPYFVEPFVLTPAAMNHLSGIADRLSLKGYETAFFHGAQNNSMGFQAFARSTGFRHYLGRTEFEADHRFGGASEFDGTWAIWDEPFMQFYCAKMSEMQEPFMTALFTATSHNPFVIPEQYKERFPEEQLPIHKCIRYTDNALRHFFNEARKQPWFDNTIFVILSDHTNQSNHPEFQSDIGGFSSPVIIYDPQMRYETGIREGIAQQIDVMPTIMGMLGYDTPYMAFGIDLLNTPADSTWAVSYLNGIYQYVKYGHVLQFDGRHTTAVYQLEDRLMKHNLIGKFAHQQDMEQELKAIIYQYMYRMTHDMMYPEDGKQAGTLSD
ncbi:MAG: LTA synthase family protein [Paludibacteraceae bacterium]|nr:LTA synthase family protein [Paludibacteraceae bacterium]